MFYNNCLSLLDFILEFAVGLGIAIIKAVIIKENFGDKAKFA